MSNHVSKLVAVVLLVLATMAAAPVGAGTWAPSSLGNTEAALIPSSVDGGADMSGRGTSTFIDEGVEALLASNAIDRPGIVLEDVRGQGYTPGSFDLDTAGDTAVVHMRDDDGSPRHRVFTVDTTTRAVSEISLPETGFNNLTVRISGDGQDVIMGSGGSSRDVLFHAEVGDTTASVVSDSDSGGNDFEGRSPPVVGDSGDTFYLYGDDVVYQLRAPGYSPTVFWDPGPLGFNSVEGEIAVSPDNTRVMAHVRNTGSGDRATYLIDGAGEALVTDANPIRAFAFSHDGTSLAYCTGTTGNEQCWQAPVTNPTSATAHDTDTSLGATDATSHLAYGTGGGFALSHNGEGNYLDINGQRRLAHPSNFVREHLNGAAVSTDGETTIGRDNPGTRSPSTYLFRPGPQDGVTYPDIQAVTGTVNGDDTYTITVTANYTPQGLNDPFVQPLVDGWAFADTVLADPANPLSAVGTGGWDVTQDGDTYTWTNTTSTGGVPIPDAMTIVVSVSAQNRDVASWVEINPLGGGGSGGISIPPTTFDGDPATTERVDTNDPEECAIAIGQARFASVDGARGARGGQRRANHAVIARVDNFVDSLAGLPLVGDGNFILTDPSQLSSRNLFEIQRTIERGGRIYLLGGTAAVSAEIENDLLDRGYDVVRLAGPSRFETAVRIAQEVRAIYNNDDTRVLVARASSPPENPTAAWADSITGGTYAAHAQLPVVVTGTDDLHPVVAGFLDQVNPSEVILLGGTAAVGPSVEAAITHPVNRVAGSNREDTALRVASDLWQVDASEARSFVMLNGFSEVGWKFGMPGAGAAADAGAPMLMVNPLAESLNEDTEFLLSSFSGQPEVDLLILGDESQIPLSLQTQLDSVDS